MWRRHTPKPLDEVDCWLNEGLPDDVEQRLNDVARQHMGRPEAEVRAALESASIAAPTSVLNGLATRISVLQPAKAPLTRVRMRTD